MRFAQRGRGRFASRLFDDVPHGIGASNAERRRFVFGRGRRADDRRRCGAADARPIAIRRRRRCAMHNAARLVAETRATCRSSNEVVVVPSLTNVRRFRLLAMQHRLSDAGVRALKQRGEGDAFAGLRDYVPGDDPRLVDWKGDGAAPAVDHPRADDRAIANGHLADRLRAGDDAACRALLSLRARAVVGARC